ncbi:enoyl-CoA hydratase [Elioraea tepidiphila]|jgi:enoyl-CoA hydratase/carnithine racemase|uniref:enoyl-CoA hydratase n=1 Tax=Elioraea tepidiphila TaxID=457934 RepID=UPI002FDB5CF7
MADLLLREDDAGVATLTLNRPAARNALSLALLEAMRDALAALAGDRAVKAVVITGAGPGFCAGHDLRELTEARNDPDRGRAFFEVTMARCAEVMQAVATCPKPTIAAVNGIATAAGCQLVASCDIAIADPRARFCTPGVNIGLFCATPAVALSRAVARRDALEMLYTGDLYDAAHAQRIGLVNRVVGEGQALAEAKALATRIAERPASVVQGGKAAFLRQEGLTLPKAYADAARVMVEQLLAGASEEGIGAFLEKRAPVWPQD